MIDIRIEGMDRLRRQLGSLDRQMPFIMSKTLNDVGFKIRDALIGEMVGNIDRVKPWTLRQTFVKKSTKRDLAVEIGPSISIKKRIMGKIGHVLAPHITGEQRVNRKAERKLQSLGLMPSGYYAVPSSTIKLDRFGNITRAAWNHMDELIADRKLFVSDGRTARTAHLSPGIYQRYGRGLRVRPLILFKPRVVYKKILEWESQARASVNREMMPAFRRAVEYAIRTQR